MKTFDIRSDDFSIQITSRQSAKLFVRLSPPVIVNGRLTVSDFLLGDAGQSLAQAAFSEMILSAKGGPLEEIVFLDLVPGKDVVGDSRARDEVVRRHDQIVFLAKEHFSANGGVSDAYLQPRDGKFDSILKVKWSPCDD